MQRSQLSDITVFVEVARSNGFRAAAERLKLGPGSVSEAVQRLEDRLGVRLFERTTRSVALTHLGERLYRQCVPALSELESALHGLDEETDKVAGTLRLTAPRSAGLFFLDALIARYAAAYPDVSVELIYDDQKVDLVASRIDAAIRSHMLLEQDTHAVAIGPKLGMSLVASPAYLDRRGIPRAPGDLGAHDGICFAFGSSDRLAPWTFRGDAGEFSVMPRPRMIVNDLASMLQFAEAGLGLAYLYAETARHLVEGGKLVCLLGGQIPSLQRYTVNYLSKRHMPARLRAFIDSAKAMGASQ